MTSRLNITARNIHVGLRHIGDAKKACSQSDWPGGSTYLTDTVSYTQTSSSGAAAREEEEFIRHVTKQ